MTSFRLSTRMMADLQAITEPFNLLYINIYNKKTKIYSHDMP